MRQIEQDLRLFIVDNFLYGQDGKLSDSDSFLEAGIIDSTGVLELVSFLEKTYGFAIEDDELIPENLDSIDNLTSFVRRKAAVTPAKQVVNAG